MPRLRHPKPEGYGIRARVLLAPPRELQPSVNPLLESEVLGEETRVEQAPRQKEHDKAPRARVASHNRVAVPTARPRPSCEKAAKASCARFWMTVPGRSSGLPTRSRSEGGENGKTTDSFGICPHGERHVFARISARRLGDSVGNLKKNISRHVRCLPLARRDHPCRSRAKTAPTQVSMGTAARGPSSDAVWKPNRGTKARCHAFCGFS